MEEQFKIVDVNKDGFIDADELKKVMRNLGMKYSDEEITMMLEQADVNGKITFRLVSNLQSNDQSNDRSLSTNLDSFSGSGKIEQDDFMKVMSDYLDSEKEESFDVRDLFDFFDTDKDGFISQDELEVFRSFSFLLLVPGAVTFIFKMISNKLYLTLQFAVKELLQDAVSTKESKYCNFENLEIP